MRQRRAKAAHFDRATNGFDGAHAPSLAASDKDFAPPCADRPPSTGISTPLRYDDSSEIRKTTSGAMSSTPPVRPSGVSAMLAPRKLAGAEAVIGVSMKP